MLDNLIIPILAITSVILIILPKEKIADLILKPFSILINFIEKDEKYNKLIK